MYSFWDGSCSHLSTQCCADGEGAALGSAVRGKLEDLGVDGTHSVVLEVHQVLRHLVESSWGLQGVVLVVVVIFLSALNFPFEVRPGRVELLGAVELGSSLDEPVGCDDAASVRAIAAEAAVVLLGEVQESLACICGGVPSTV